LERPRGLALLQRERQLRLRAARRKRQAFTTSAPVRNQAKLFRRLRISAKKTEASNMSSDFKQEEVTSPVDGNQVDEDADARENPSRNLLRTRESMTKADRQAAAELTTEIARRAEELRRAQRADKTERLRQARLHAERQA
jgi:hypothetical protein